MKFITKFGDYVVLKVGKTIELDEKTIIDITRLTIYQRREKLKLIYEYSEVINKIINDILSKTIKLNKTSREHVINAIADAIDYIEKKPMIAIQWVCMERSKNNETT